MTDVSQNPLPRSILDQLLSGSRGTFMDTEDAASMMSTQPRYRILGDSGVCLCHARLYCVSGIDLQP